MASQKGGPMELVKYLYTRLSQLGVQTIYGTTWETNSIVQTNPGQRYIRNVNEAHAAYAADAYARVKGLAALVNTHGSNHSITNQVLLTARAEDVPVVHIVGYASTGPNYPRNFRQVQIGSLDQVVAYSSVVLLGVCDAISHAPAWIDAVLKSCVATRRPVYIGVPMAYAKCLVDGSRLGLGLGLDKTVGMSSNGPTREGHVAELILGYLQRAKDAVIIVNGGVIRQKLRDVVRELVVRTGLPTFVTLEGREAIDTALPNYGGLYAGSQSTPEVKKRGNEADLLVHIGPCKSHVNAQYLHYLRFPTKIEIHDEEHLVGRTVSYGVSAQDLLTAVLARLDQDSLSPGPVPPNNGIEDPLDKVTLDLDKDSDSAFSKHDVYTRVLKWMRDGDFLINHFSIGDAQNWVHHVIWERKDVAFAACLGVAMASKEMGNARRILVFVDAQYCKHASHELATILQSGLSPIVFITREVPGMECLEDEDEFIEKRPEDEDSMAELDLPGHYQVNYVQSRHQLSDFLDSMDTSCLQIVELALDSPA